MSENTSKTMFFTQIPLLVRLIEVFVVENRLWINTVTPWHVTGPIPRPNGVTGYSPGASRLCSAVGFSIRHRTFARCSYPVIMSLGVKLDLSQPIPTGPGDAASRYYRPKLLLMGGAHHQGFLTKSLKGTLRWREIPRKHVEWHAWA